MANEAKTGIGPLLAKGVMMRLDAFGPAGAAVLLLLGGCQIQHTTVVEQASAASLTANGASVQAAPRPTQQPRSPCASPAGTGPFEHLGRTVVGGKVVLSARALSEHVSGCAGVRFRIGPDGAPRDIDLMAEYPLGYGFGETAVAAIEKSRWEARDDAAWRYLVLNLHP